MSNDLLVMSIFFPTPTLSVIQPTMSLEPLQNARGGESLTGAYQHDCSNLHHLPEVGQYLRPQISIILNKVKCCKLLCYVLFLISYLVFIWNLEVQGSILYPDWNTDLTS